MYTVYSKDGCPFCERTVMALDTFGADYELLKLDVDFEKQEMLDVIPETHRTFPAIFKDDEFLGGFEDFKKEFLGNKVDKFY